MCLVLLMCTITRSYIRYIIRVIKTLPQILHTVSQTHTPLVSKYAALSAALRGCVISPIQFEYILDATEQILNLYYAKMKAGQRQEIEIQLLAEASIPPILYPVIHKLLSQPVESARLKAGDTEEVLAFRPWGSVSLVDDEQTLQWQNETTWDGSRKVEITHKKTKTRTCLRCTGIMEEPAPIKERSHRGWLANLTRTCVCGGSWIVDKAPEMA